MILDLEIKSEIKNILHELPSEGPTLDYKEAPYNKGQKPDLIKDVIAMLNCENAVQERKFIIFGVKDKVDNDNKNKNEKICLKNEKEERLIGLKNKFADDNEWQNIFENNIAPTPDIRTGTVDYENKTFGYFFISEHNINYVYEAKKLVNNVTLKLDKCSKDENVEIQVKLKEENTVFPCQAFTRLGSKNKVLDLDGKRKLLDIKIATETKIKEQICQFKPPYKFIFDETIGYFFDAVVKIYRSYSCELRHDIAEKIVFLTNNKELFKKCSPNKIEFCVRNFLYEMFTQHNAEGYTTICTEFKNLAEACPDLFLFKIQDLLENNDKAFNDFLKLTSESEEKLYRLYHTEKRLRRLSYSEKQYLSYSQEQLRSLKYALETLAWSEKYFCEAVNILFLISTKLNNNEMFIRSLTEILCLCRPSTNATAKQRINVFQYWISEDEETAWKIFNRLMCFNTARPIPSRLLKKEEYCELHKKYFGYVSELLNNHISNIFYITDFLVSQMERVDSVECGYDKPRYIKNIKIREPKQMTYDELWKITDKYLESAIKILTPQRSLEIIETVDNNQPVIIEMFIKKIIAKILNGIKEKISEFTQTDKENLWNKLQDIIEKHRKCYEQRWAMHEDDLIKIDNFCKFLIPNDSYLYDKRLFSQKAHNDAIMRAHERRMQKSGNDINIAIHSKDNFNQEEEAKLNKKKKEVLKKIYSDGGYDACMKFILELKSNDRDTVAIVLLSVFNENEIHRFIYGTNKEIERTICRLITEIDLDRLLKIISDDNDLDKANILSKRMLDDSLVDFVEQLNNEARRKFYE